MKAMSNAKAVVPDGLLVKLLKLVIRQEDRTISMKLHRLTALIWREEYIPQYWKDAVITVLHTKIDNRMWKLPWHLPRVPRE